MPRSLLSPYVNVHKNYILKILLKNMYHNWNSFWGWNVKRHHLNWKYDFTCWPDHLEGFLIFQVVTKAYFVFGINSQKVEISFCELLNLEFLNVGRNSTNLHPHVTLGITHSHLIIKEKLFSLEIKLVLGTFVHKNLYQTAYCSQFLMKIRILLVPLASFFHLFWIFW